jgi:hypothetical protein
MPRIIKRASVFRSRDLKVSFYPDTDRMTDTRQAILLATLVCGTLDAAAATTQAATLAVPAQRVWQSVASGIMGSRALERGWRSGVFGLALHFVISFLISTLYVLASRRMPFLLRHALIAGALYGVGVYLVMNYIVLPLSRPAEASLQSEIRHHAAPHPHRHRRLEHRALRALLPATLGDQKRNRARHNFQKPAR